MSSYDLCRSAGGAVGISGPAALPALFRAALLVLGACAASACREQSGAPGAAASASAVPAAAAGASGGAGELVEEDPDIRPVYPLESKPPEPLALKLCEAVADLPERRRAECCKLNPGFTGSSECVRTLSYALRSGAVTVDAAALDRCRESYSRQLEGCGWVGPNTPLPPPECTRLIKGALPEGASCRSSLECKQDLHCRGLTGTRAGKCTPSLPSGAVCGGGTDTLATYTRQLEWEASHPDCGGYCLRGRCQDFVTAGGACTVSGQCGAGRHCAGGACRAGSLPAAGSPCPGGECERGALCAAATCRAPKAEGESCRLDSECAGGCVRDGSSGEGRCGMQCAVPGIPKTRSFER